MILLDVLPITPEERLRRLERIRQHRSVVTDTINNVRDSVSDTIDATKDAIADSVAQSQLLWRWRDACIWLTCIASAEQ